MRTVCNSVEILKKRDKFSKRLLRKVKMDIDWQHSFEGHRDGTVHQHTWHRGKRSLEHSPLIKSEIFKFKKAIEETSGRKDLIWEWK